MHEDVSQLVPLARYFGERKHLFPTRSGGQWFLRRHKAELIEEGALLLVNGRFHANARKFDQTVFVIGQRLAHDRARAHHNAEAVK
jgi:hypothetical protein